MHQLSESLAGRVAVVEVPTFDFSESFGSPLSAALENIADLSKLKQLQPGLTMQEVFQSCLYGGYPQPFLARKDLGFFDSWFSNHFQTYINRDIRSLFPTLKIGTFQKFVRMLAQSSGQIINYSDFARPLDVWG